MNVRKSFHLADTEGAEMTDHIIGTNPIDLTQIYIGHVTIKGSLTLINALVSGTRDNFGSQPIYIDSNPNENTDFIPVAENAVIIVNGSPFAIENAEENFWMKSIDQVNK